MHIVYVSSEVEPFAKTGGLADVSGALPRSIARRGERISLITPFYRETRQRVKKTSAIADITVSAGLHKVRVQILRELEGSGGVSVFFVRCDEFFDRDGLYENAAGAFPDNHLRFICFCRAVLEFCRTPDMQPDILHLHDWQTALIAAYLRQPGDRLLQGCASMLTIHNLAYQGIFPSETFKLTGLPRSFWNPGQLEFWDQVNLLKGGIVNADLITTVSPTYAREITTPEFGCGLEGVLAAREHDLFGILNGADYDAWDPARDSLIKTCYSARDLSGKQDCKNDLIKRFKLDPTLAKRPLIGCISRLVDQKGFDLIKGVFNKLLKTDIGFVLLGTGEKRYHRFFSRLALQHPGRVGVLLAYDNAVAHQIEAGCDLFLMPSRYEPCGLTQMHSLKYGTVPVVRATGGLADTIIDCDQDPERGNGFVFKPASPAALLDAIMRSLECFEQPARWQALVQRCMACDFSWDASAQKYLELYRKALEKKAGGD
jgi:starch synthase